MGMLLKKLPKKSHIEIKEIITEEEKNVKN